MNPSGRPPAAAVAAATHAFAAAAAVWSAAAAAAALWGAAVVSSVGKQRQSLAVGASSWLNRVALQAFLANSIPSASVAAVAVAAALENTACPVVPADCHCQQWRQLLLHRPAADVTLAESRSLLFALGDGEGFAAAVGGG